MTHHICRVTMRATATPRHVDAALEGWRDQGRSNPALKSFNSQVADVPSYTGSGVDH